MNNSFCGLCPSVIFSKEKILPFLKSQPAAHSNTSPLGLLHINILTFSIVFLLFHIISLVIYFLLFLLEYRLHRGKDLYFIH